MTPTEGLVFGVTLFLALVSLLAWKRRRDKVHERLNQKLRGYISVQEGEKTEEHDGDSLIHVA
jgi:hypothetical protein